MAVVKAKPDAYHNVTPYLFIKGAADAIDYYKRIFGAQEVMRMPGPGGLIMHAELKIGDSIVMMSDENPQWGTKGPLTLGGTPVSLHLYVEDVDSVAKKAVEAGAKIIREVKDQFYGDRSGTLIDPFGHMWSVATRVEDVAPEEMRKRVAAMMSQAAGG